MLCAENMCKLLRATSNYSHMQNMPATLHRSNIHGNQAHQYCGAIMQNTGADMFLPTALCCSPRFMVPYAYDFRTPVLLARVGH